MMMTKDASNKSRQPVGYRSPPREHQWPPGVSGNPNGSRPGRGKKPRLHFYDELLTGQEAGRQVQLTRGELLIRRAEKRAAEGESKFARLLLKEKARVDAARAKSAYDERKLVGNYARPDEGPMNLDDLLERLGIATKLHRFKSSARMAIEPWAVQDALTRLGDEKLTPEQQRIIFEATHLPNKVSFPAWWEDEFRGAKRKYSKRSSA